MIKRRHREELADLEDEARFRRLCELNTETQVDALATSGVRPRRLGAGPAAVLHGWIYDVATGLIHDLHHAGESVPKDWAE